MPAAISRLSKADRRKHERHVIENSVLITANDIFQLIDISRGGFCVKCPDDIGVEDLQDTIILNPVNQLKGYPAKCVWSARWTDDNHELLPIIAGAEFGDLTKEQTSRLIQVLKGILTENSPEQYSYDMRENN